MQIKTVRYYDTSAKILKNYHHQMLVRKNSHSLLVEMEDGTATWEDSLAASYKAKPTVTVLVAHLCQILFDPMDCSPPGIPSTEFSRREYWSGLRFPSPRDLPNPENEPASSPLQADSLLSELPWTPQS